MYQRGLNDPTAKKKKQTKKRKRLGSLVHRPIFPKTKSNAFIFTKFLLPF